MKKIFIGVMIVISFVFVVKISYDSHFTAALAARADAAQELALSWEKRILSPIALAGTLS